MVVFYLSPIPYKNIRGGLKCAVLVAVFLKQEKS